MEKNTFLWLYLIFIVLIMYYPPHIKHLILCYSQLKVIAIKNSVVNSLVVIYGSYKEIYLACKKNYIFSNRKKIYEINNKKKDGEMRSDFFNDFFLYITKKRKKNKGELTSFGVQNYILSKENKIKILFNKKIYKKLELHPIGLFLKLTSRGQLFTI